ncbi:histidinol-phosphate transaminase [Wenzhouxiangella limi]|uniref:Histidinol-phosphate aminotransferase n=1 Tax=Wenzhouxiangella limi TaxID=2707351 RepID=A0A845V2T2_9GAMM|nr:histidinol-phosphate transaminase [Wenzhouxiangella limi]NDY94315.1 histidinol-phosphate transaminase [Wenzhouxiangella limi]
MNPAALARAEIRALKPYASARALADSAGVLLNANENPWPPAGDGGLALNRYPDPQPAALKARLAEVYGVDESRLLITRGSDEGIDLLVRVFCRAGQDRVLVCPPCFGMYALSARVQNADVIEAPLIEVGGQWQLDTAAVAQTLPCRLYFLCSPNNPTGNRIAADTVLELARRVSDHGLVVIDEAYIEFSDSDSLADKVGLQPNLVVLRTLSKAYALAGCRIGAVIADPDVVDLLRRIIAPYPLPTPSVSAALAALTPEALARQQDQLARLERLKAALLEQLELHADIKQVWPGEANFVLVRVEDAQALVQDAFAAGIRLRDQSTQPDLDNCVRITVGSEEEMQTLAEFLRDWQP